MALELSSKGAIFTARCDRAAADCTDSARTRSSGSIGAMKRFLFLIAMLAATLCGQTGSKRTEEQLKALYDAHKSDFDYLLGDWEFTAQSTDYGKYGGRWSALRTEKGQILDEYRVLGDNGETFHVTTTIRAYNAFADRWELIGMDIGGGLQDFGTAHLVDGEMHIEQKFGVAGGSPTILRIRYYNIQPDRFSWSAELSKDGGKTWAKDYMNLEARRIGPARSLDPLTPAKTQ
jgi:hypothetical protein